jgi:hypothetical protein
MFRLVNACVTDAELTPEEAQIFQTLTRAMSEDVQPDAHACKLKLSLTCMDSPMRCPWDVASELSAYYAKLTQVSAVCRLTSEEEHILFGVANVGHGSAASTALTTASATASATSGDSSAVVRLELSNRHSYVQSILTGQGSAPASIPPRPVLEAEWDTVVDKSCIDKSVLSTLANKITTNTSYSRPEECKGAVAAHRLHQWMDNGLKLGGGKDNLGFMFVYELMTNTLSVKILPDDSTYALGNLIM